MVITVATLLHQLLIFIPTIIASTTLITGTIDAAFNVQEGNAKHIISWIVAVLCGVITVMTGGLAFGFGAWDYLIGAGFGLIAGGASNGLYDWPVVSEIIDNLYNLFHKDGSRAKKEEKK